MALCCSRSPPRTWSPRSCFVFSIIWRPNPVTLLGRESHRVRAACRPGMSMGKPPVFVGLSFQICKWVTGAVPAWRSVDEGLTAANSGGKASARRGHQLSVSLHRGAETSGDIPGPILHPWAIRNVHPSKTGATRAVGDHSFPNTETEFGGRRRDTLRGTH